MRKSKSWLTVKDKLLVEVRTPRLQADFHGLQLVSLATASGESLLKRRPGEAPAGIELVFGDGRPLPIGLGPDARTEAVQLDAHLAHIYVEDIEGDVCLRVRVDPEGRLVIEPSAQTLRHGLGIARLNLAGVAPGFKLVGPLRQGYSQELDHPFVAGKRWFWPKEWEAGIVALQGGNGGWSVRCHDDRFLPKALLAGHPADPRTVSVDTEAIGPWDTNLAVGNLAWIIDTHTGGWENPFREYRDWLWKTGHLAALAAQRPDWAGDIRLTVQWCPCDAAILDALAKVTAPQRVLLHVPHWRRDKYDENYPDYTPGEQGTAFMAEAWRRGFHVMPHFNYFAMDPGHPFFAKVRPFVLRELGNKSLEGWRWKDNAWQRFPQALGKIDKLRAEKVMAFIHSGSSVWRRELERQIARAMGALEADGIFVDQTFHANNVDNAIVENLSSMEGMLALTRELSEMAGGYAIGGEGRNELCAQYESFAQIHMFFNQQQFEQLEFLPINNLLFGNLCRAMGYTGMDGDTRESELRLLAYEKIGALPTLVVSRAEQITEPLPAIRRVLDRAR